MKIYDAEFEYLALVASYPYLLENTILKEEYFSVDYRRMFSILAEEKRKSQEFIVENLNRYNGFNIDLFAELLCGNMYYSSRDNKFKELEKTIIKEYQKRRCDELVKSYRGNGEDLYRQLTQINEIDFNENDYIKAQDMIDSLARKNKKLELGYDVLDRALNLSRNDLLILAGGTGTGKTAFALNVLSRLSRNKDYQLIYFNMEMSKTILYKRLIGIETEIPLTELNDISNLDTNKKRKIYDAMNDIEKREIILISKSQTIEEIKKTIMRIKTDKHIVAIVDHIGLIKSSGNSLYERTTNVAKGLRTISLDADCTLIGLCQLSRESQKEGKEPKLQDLRDSGEIEQSARKVVLIHNPNPNDKNQTIKMNLIIAKNDDGKTDTKFFDFNRLTQKFQEDWIKQNRRY